jgi:hypothetical protein
MLQVFSNRDLPHSLTETGRHQIEALQARLPTGESWLYKPKLDGFRGLLWHRNGAVAELLSRKGRDLGPCSRADSGWPYPACVHADRR